MLPKFENSGWIPDTYYYNNDVQQWEKGPDMNIGRALHGCGSFTLMGTTVFAVAGGWTTQSTEFLEHKPGSQWVQGKLYYNLEKFN